MNLCSSDLPEATGRKTPFETQWSRSMDHMFNDAQFHVSRAPQFREVTRGSSRP